MNAMKPTMSNDGELRFTVSIKVRAGLIELQNAVAWRLLSDHGDDIRSAGNKGMAIESCLRGRRSRKACFEALNLAVSRAGERHEYWGDDFNDAVCREVAEQVRVLVAKAFPELKKP